VRVTATALAQKLARIFFSYIRSIASRCLLCHRDTAAARRAPATLPARSLSCLPLYTL